MKNSINLADMKSWWEQSGGETMGGHFDYDLYLKFLEIYNLRTDEYRRR